MVNSQPKARKRTATPGPAPSAGLSKPDGEALRSAKAGVRVQRGLDWKWDNQDGGVGTCGITVDSLARSGWVRVHWSGGLGGEYRVGAEGAYDLAVVKEEACQASKRSSSLLKGSLAQLAFCFLGLQVSFLTWGYVQEKVMTKEYGVGPSASKFPSATFCVFSNRVLAILLAACFMFYQHGFSRLPAPLTSFAWCSLSNSLSSFGQYEALRHVSFPMQTLSKSAKVVPVMLMGRVLNKKSYAWDEYALALAISSGVFLFSYSSSSADGAAKTLASDASPVRGLLMLGLYLASDSFTSQWQSRVYKEYPKVDQYQMMFATNFWSILMTTAFLVASGEMFVSLAFLAEHPEAIFDNGLIALTSATGQLFIFYTIKKFGPVAFTIMMTTRQVLSLIISALAFNHALGAGAWLGVAVVFAAAFYKGLR